MNNCNMSGRLTANAEMKYTEQKKAKVNFYLAVKRGYKNADGTDATDFVPCQLWGKFAEALHLYLRKGTCVSVSGQMHFTNYEDKAGNKKSWTVLNVHDLELLAQPRKKDTSEEKAEWTPVASINDDGLPF